MTIPSATNPVYQSVVKSTSESGSLGAKQPSPPDQSRTYTLLSIKNPSLCGARFPKEEYTAQPEAYREALFSNPGSKYFVIDLYDPSLEAFLDYYNDHYSAGRGEKPYSLECISSLSFHWPKAFIRALLSIPASRYSIVDSEEPPFLKFIDDRCVADPEYRKHLQRLIGTSDSKHAINLKATNKRMASRNRA